MKTPSSHIRQLKKKNYNLDLSEKYMTQLSAEMIIILKNYGYWMQALAHGHISPITDDQKHFMEVVRGEHPKNKYEEAWHKLQKLRLRDFDPNPDKNSLEHYLKSTHSSGSTKTCPQCNGDGGAGGRCPTCCGSGSI